jgi:glyoxylase-like metal-dependent hydrolase (beta-lactamase superfamily II)
MNITSEIFQVGGDGFSSPQDAAIYLINFEGHVAIVDSGCGDHTDIILKNIQSCGVQLDQIKYLLLTHCHYDHTGGAANLREKTGCKIIAHKIDADFLERGNNEVTAARWYGQSITPFFIDKKLTKKEVEINLGSRTIKAIHSPGHSPGSVVYVAESDGLKVIFAQDVHGPLDPSLLSNKNDYLNSLERLIQLNADILCEGHYGIYRGKQEITQFIGSFL